LMAIPTLLIGFLPSYQQIGLFATISLIILRLLQGFAAGGELSTSACYLFETSATSPYRSLLCTCVSIGQTLGILLGSVVIAILNFTVPRETIETWAWRIPFWMSIPLSFFIFVIRNSIEETVVQG